MTLQGNTDHQPLDASQIAGSKIDHSLEIDRIFSMAKILVSQVCIRRMRPKPVPSQDLSSDP